MTSTPSLKIPENFIRERDKATEAEREDHEEVKLRMAKSGREKARRQEGEKTENKIRKLLFSSTLRFNKSYQSFLS